MKENITSNVFRKEREQYFPLYQTFFIAQNTSRTIPNGSKSSMNDYDEFNSGTKQVLQSALGVGGGPLSYVIQSIKVRPRNSTLCSSTRRAKIYWKAPLVGAVFNTDNRCIWAYLLQRYQDTPGWIRIQRYRDNGRESWLALCRNHGVDDIEPPDDTPYEDDDYIYINHKLLIYFDVYDIWYSADQSGHAPMPSKKMDLEMEFFTVSRCRGIIYGLNMNPSFVRPERIQELARRSTSDAPDIMSVESRAVSAKRASELLQPVGMIRPFA